MPILLVLLIVASCAPVDWPAPPWNGAFVVACTALSVLLPVCAAGVLSRWATHAVRLDPDRRGQIVSRYGRLRRLTGYANLIVAATTIVSLGWGWAVRHRFHFNSDTGPVLMPFAELLVPAPYLAGIFLSWLLHHDAERAFHEAGKTAGTPEYWSRSGRFLYQLRPFALLILMPAVVFAGQQSFARVAPEWAASLPVKIAEMLLLPIVFFLLPLAVKPILGLKTLPAGPHRELFTRLAARWNFRCADLLLWPTRGSTANAMVIGVIPQARYVVFTDRLLDAMSDDELAAVFGHEVGHARHRHIPFYAAFFLLSSVVVAGSVAVATDWLLTTRHLDAGDWQTWLALPPLAIFGAYLFLVFGYLSRTCERQADLFGVRTAALGEPSPAKGIYAMVRALERVAYLNGMDTSISGRGGWRARIAAWQHGSIGDRVGFLLRLLDDPGLEPRTQRHAFFVRMVIVLVLLAGLGALLGIVGGERLMNEMW